MQNQSHTASQGHSHYSNPHSLTSESTVLALLSISRPLSLAPLPQTVFHHHQLQFLPEWMQLPPQEDTRNLHAHARSAAWTSCWAHPWPTSEPKALQIVFSLHVANPSLITSSCTRLPSPRVPLKWSLLWLLEKCHHHPFGEGSLLWISEKYGLFIVQRVSGPKLL